jgi:hypothetical protein
MRQLGYAIALLTFLVCPASADTALPGLVQENLLLPITLPNGSQVKLEAMVIRPDRPERSPLVVLVHGTPRAVVTRPYLLCAVALVVRKGSFPKVSLERATTGIILLSGE